MTKTLYAYLSRDLAKVTLMALAGFTLVMSMFGVVEPLRKQGISGIKVLALFGFTVPVMLSLTLPIAALFAATLVYGRFSNSNELLASKASGISPVNLLKPALVLGTIVTVFSLALSNYITPVLAAAGGRFALANLEGIVAQQLRTKSYVDKGLGGRMVHVSEMGREKGTAHGVVAMDTRNPKDVRLLIAADASIDFDDEDGQGYVAFRLFRAAAARTCRYDLVWLGNYTLGSRLLENPIKEKPSWYDWGELRVMLKDPGCNREIRSILSKIRRQALREMFGKSVVETINSGQQFELTDGYFTYTISAGGAELDNRGEVILGSKGSEVVKVVVLRNGVVRKTITGDAGSSGKIFTVWSARSKETTIVAEISGRVLVRDSSAGEGSEPPSRSEWMTGGLGVPQKIVERIKTIKRDDIYRNAEAYTSNSELLWSLASRINRLRSKIVAEMHGRVAYSVSCCLMVAMGAALGLMFRGGQVLSAFAISVVPAAVVIVLVVMGKELVTNPDISPAVGLGAIWSGLVLLLVGNAFIYARLARR